MRSEAKTVAGYLAELPAERRAVVAAVRKVIRKHLPKGYVETVNWGMICYEIPLRVYPDTYNGQPLSYAALAAQKHYYAVYLAVYQDKAQENILRDGFRRAGKRLDMGKCCVRFRKLDDLPLDVIGKLIAGTKPAAFIRQYEASRLRRGGC